MAGSPLKPIRTTRLLSFGLTCAFVLWIAFFAPSCSSLWAEEIQLDDAPVLTLADAVSLALENNRELLATRFDSKASVHSRSEAYSAYWPQVSYSGSMRKSESDRYKMEIPAGSPFEGLFDPDQLGFSGANYDNHIQIGQLIFDRSVIGQIRLANIQVEASKWQEKGQEQAVVFNSVAAYLDVLRAGELLQRSKAASLPGRQAAQHRQDQFRGGAAHSHRRSSRRTDSLVRASRCGVRRDRAAQRPGSTQQSHGRVDRQALSVRRRRVGFVQSTAGKYGARPGLPGSLRYRRRESSLHSSGRLSRRTIRRVGENSARRVCAPRFGGRQLRFQRKRPDWIRGRRMGDAVSNRGSHF